MAKLLFVAGSLALLPATIAFDLTEPSFDRWRARYGIPEYNSREARARALRTWRDNLRRVEQHNSNPSKTYRMALNAHAALSNNEYRAKRLMPRKDVASEPKASQPKASPEVAPTATLFAKAPPPASLNWVHKGVIPPIKDQGQCGSCWAFSAVSAMEGAYNLKHQGSINNFPASCSSQQCGPQNASCCSFSEQEIADCTLKGADTCNIGGEPHDGILEVVARGGKISTEQGYPYVSGKTKALTPCRPSAASFVNTGITGYTNVTSGDENALLAAAVIHPSISVGIDASSFGFQLYSSGVYVDDEGCGNNASSLDHGVAVVGFGAGKFDPPGPPAPKPGPADCDRNYKKPGCLNEAGCFWCEDSHKFGYCFNEPCPSSKAGQVSSYGAGPEGKPGQPYWLVRNSWNVDWGAGGYIAMARNHNNMCGIATDAVFADL